MTRIYLRLLITMLGATLLALAWWGWLHGGLALMQLGMGNC
ncbi:hypothetical protein [Pseudomonas schmalbachii]|nr:hypothetical protein [Pseudomonas schmalbachii]